jgi:hypothetical protein
LLAFLDVAEVEAAMVTEFRRFAGPLDIEHLHRTTTILNRLAELLDRSDPALAASCRTAVPPNTYTQGINRYAAVHALRPHVESTARRLSTTPPRR